MSDYPEETEGSRIAAEVRAVCNNLTRKERDALLKEGMSLIYPETSPEAELAKRIRDEFNKVSREERDRMHEEVYKYATGQPSEFDKHLKKNG